MWILKIMNSKLVKSLVEIIESLSQDEYVLFQQQLAMRSIQKTKGVCGGHARIRDTRIPVWTIISLEKQGADDAELLDNYPDLTLFDLVVARNYYSGHHQEIDTLLASYADEDEHELHENVIELRGSEVDG